MWQPQIANSVDLLPTILHLIGVNEPNPFEGNSLFDDRRGQTGVLGDHAYLLYSNQLDEHGKRVIDSFSRHDCPADPEPTGYLMTECEQIHWHAWKMRLLSQHRIWQR